MGIPKLKRIKVASEATLWSWLARSDLVETRMMLVTHTNAAMAKQIGRAAVEEALTSHGWTPMRYALDGGLLGQAIEREVGADVHG